VQCVHQPRVCATSAIAEELRRAHRGRLLPPINLVVPEHDVENELHVLRLETGISRAELEAFVTWYSAPPPLAVDGSAAAPTAGGGPSGAGRPPDRAACEILKSALFWEVESSRGSKSTFTYIHCRTEVRARPAASDRPV
jgi:hypothetical protein